MIYGIKVNKTMLKESIQQHPLLEKKLLKCNLVVRP